MFRIFSTAVLCVALTAPALARTMTPDDLFHIVSAANPVLAPDGKTLAYVASHVDRAADKRRQTIELVELASGAQRALTYAREGLAGLAFSPDGRGLAFLANDGGKHEQIFVISFAGGDARQITSAPRGVQQFAWRPDGSAIAFVTQDEDARRKAIEAHHDQFDLGDDDYLTEGYEPPSHVWLVGSEGENAHRLTSGAWSVATSYPPSPPSSPLAWSPDGATLLFTRVPDTRDGDAYRSQIERLDIASGKVAPLTGHDAFEGFPAFSNDGTKVAYLYSRDGDPNNENDIMVTDAKGGGPGIDVSRALDRAIFRVQWMPDGSLLAGSHDGLQTRLHRLHLDGTSQTLDTGDVQPNWSFWIDTTIDAAGDVAFAGTTPKRASEVYLLRAGAPLAKLTALNGEIDALDLGTQREIAWQNDGFHEDGLLTLPPGYVETRKYPLIVLPHGGPQAASVDGFDSFSQILAARGWMVFEPNYRGSDNFGNAYERAIYMDAGAGPGRDVMAGLAEVEKLGTVDTKRMAVSGWSYGGYMTSWLMTHYHVWKTAISGAAVNNFVDMYDLGDANVQIAFSFKGSPWVGDNMKDYVAQSPITYAAQTRCPVLIVSDTGDVRVPIAQSYEMYHALRDNHIPARFVAIPVGGHFPSDPVRTIDVYSLWIQWMATHL